MSSAASLRLGWWGTDAELEISGVLLKHNRVAGVRWERGHINSVRGEWHCSSFVRWFQFVKCQPLAPQREQAQSHLRHWLQNKAPTHKIEEWLTPQT